MVPTNTFTVNNGLLGVAGLGAHTNIGPVYKDDAEATAGGGTTRPAKDVASAFTKAAAPKAPNAWWPPKNWGLWLGVASDAKGAMSQNRSLGNRVSDLVNILGEARRGNPFAKHFTRTFDITQVMSKDALTKADLVLATSFALQCDNLSAAKFIVTAAKNELTALRADPKANTFALKALLELGADASEELKAGLKESFFPPPSSMSYDMALISNSVILGEIKKGAVQQVDLDVRRYHTQFLCAFGKLTGYKVTFDDTYSIIRNCYGAKGLVVRVNAGDLNAFRAIELLINAGNDTDKTAAEEAKKEIDPAAIVEAEIANPTDEGRRIIYMMAMDGNKKAWAGFIKMLDAYDSRSDINKNASEQTIRMVQDIVVKHGSFFDELVSAVANGSAASVVAIKEIIPPVVNRLKTERNVIALAELDRRVRGLADLDAQDLIRDALFLSSDVGSFTNGSMARQFTALQILAFDFKNSSVFNNLAGDPVVGSGSISHIPGLGPNFLYQLMTNEWKGLEHDEGIMVMVQTAYEKLVFQAKLGRSDAIAQLGKLAGRDKNVPKHIREEYAYKALDTLTAIARKENVDAVVELMSIEASAKLQDDAPTLAGFGSILRDLSQPVLIQALSEFADVELERGPDGTGPAAVLIVGLKMLLAKSGS